MSLIAQTPWHGNPRPVLSYAITEWDDVTVHYGNPVYTHYVSDLPFDEIGTVGSVQIATPSFTFAGQIKRNAVVDISWTLGGLPGGGQWVFKQDTSPEGAAHEVAQYLKGADDITTTVDGRTGTMIATNGEELILVLMTYVEA